MTKWAGTRDYNEWLEYARGESIDDILESVKCDIYCIATMFAGKTMPFPWIIIWNSYIELKTNLDVLAERGIDSYSTKITAEAMLARLKNALDKRRAEGRETRLARKQQEATMRLLYAKENIA